MLYHCQQKVLALILVLLSFGTRPHFLSAQKLLFLLWNKCYCHKFMSFIALNKWCPLSAICLCSAMTLLKYVTCCFLQFNVLWMLNSPGCLSSLRIPRISDCLNMRNSVFFKTLYSSIGSVLCIVCLHPSFQVSSSSGRKLSSIHCNIRD